MQNEHSPFTFVPAVILQSTGNVPKKDDEMPNSVMKLCRQAGWDSSIHHDKQNDLFSFSPFPFDLPKVEELSNETLNKLTKSKEDFARVVEMRNNYENKLKELSTEKPDPVPTKQQTPIVSHITEVPKSFEEIYQISVHNRQRNKDKKRERDGEVDKLINKDLLKNEKAMNACNDYFVEKNDDKDTDSVLKKTLRFTKEVGWIQNNDHLRSVEAAHSHELSMQQQSQEVHTDHSVDHLRVSDHNAPALKASFDYSKVSQSAIGASTIKLDKDISEVFNKPIVKTNNNKQTNKQQPFRVKQELLNPYLFNSQMDEK